MSLIGEFAYLLPIEIVSAEKPSKDLETSFVRKLDKRLIFSKFVRDLTFKIGSNIIAVFLNSYFILRLFLQVFG